MLFVTNKFRKVVHWFERGTNSQAISLVSCSQDKNTRLLLFYFFECLVWFCQGVTRIIHQPQGESSTVQSMACILLLVTLVGFSLLSTLDEWSRIGASGKAQELVANYKRHCSVPPEDFPLGTSSGIGSFLATVSLEDAIVGIKRCLFASCF